MAKNPNAVLLGHLGGQASAKKVPKEVRQANGRKGAEKRWNKINKTN